MNGFYYITTYGCQMNVHESEKIAGMLEDLGYKATEEEKKADIFVFNTCCIREHAEQRAYGNIGALKKLKKANKNIIIAVCGCMTQQEDAANKLKNTFPFVDIILGTHNLYKLEEFVKKKLESNKNTIEVLEKEGAIQEDVPMTRTSGINAWVNITYGCNNFCTYCIVPYVRGRERSRKKEDILNEVEKLVNEGYKEITLLGQNVNSYGNDLGDGYTFANLLEDVAKIDGKFRVRFMTSHPKDLSVEVIKTIAKYDKLCNYIHLPIQSGSDAVLKAMNRHYDSKAYLDIVEKINEYLPNAKLSTDIMVGFPGETDKDFLDTIELVKKVRYASAFTFIYSRRSGTVADKMENQIDEKTKKYRIDELIKVQNEISTEISNSYIGNTYEVLCEGLDKKDKNIYVGRTDCGRLVAFKSNTDLTGKFINMKITGANALSLKGEILEVVE